MTNRAGHDRPDSTAVGSGISLDVIPLHSTNLLTVLDADGIIQYESPSIECIYGYAQDDLVGEQVAGYFHPEDRQRVVSTFETVVTSEDHTVEAVEYRHRQADGSYCWVESVASTNPTPEGYYVVNTRDISDRKKRDQDLQQKTERLDRFASILAHDLRNPLSVAQGHLELARERHDDDNHLQAVAQAQDRIEALTTDLLTLAREGDQALNQTPVELAAIIRECWESIDSARETLVVETDLTIRADQSHLQQLLVNLLRNAVEHGGGNVTITIGDLPEEAGFYVEDDGTGLPAGAAEQVFEFGYSSTADGTGYGLAIVESVADAHGWTVQVADAEAGGARFEIESVDTVNP
ncbi:PAS domain-containing sensor histidine kinase [Haloplanus halophilus]|uniref:PAS domain-containing sensor histidine kinase n=1 Tax=Haloplanus halophilus TaxID=2949993 RepID=UPI002040B430|nr:PAS domain-containing sensor histidine kinase [Haloplanus sp. GDY1]